MAALLANRQNIFDRLKMLTQASIFFFFCKIKSLKILFSALIATTIIKKVAALNANRC